jgi:hypothetical protein
VTRVSRNFAFRLSWTMVLALVLGAALPRLGALGSDRRQVLVYYSSPVSAVERQQAIRSELGRHFGQGTAKGTEFLVFGRFREFMDLVRSTSAPVLLAPSFFTKFNDSYLPAMALRRGESRQFRYELLSLSDQWNATNLSRGRIGMVEEVGRDQLSSLVPLLLRSKVKQIKSVSKSEDLFPLLAFRSVDFVLIPSDDLKVLKEKFNMPVRRVLETGPVDRPMIFVRKGADAGQVLDLLRELPSSAWSSLGFSGVDFLGGDAR